MERLKHLFVGLGLAIAIALSGAAADVSAQAAAQASGNSVAEANTVSNALSVKARKEAPGKGAAAGPGNPGKGNGNPGKGNGNPGKGNANPGKGNGQGQPNPGQGNGTDNNVNGQGNDNQVNGQAFSGGGFGAWWRSLAARLMGGEFAADAGGWQLGRFKDAFPLAYPPGWVVRERGDGVLLSGNWQNDEYLFQITRSAQIGAASLQDWVSGDVRRLGIDPTKVRSSQAGDVQVAVVNGVQDPEYACPVACVYFWTANPAGRNQRHALGVLSQTPGSTCNPAGLDGFVNTYLAQFGSDNTPAPAATAAPTVVATATTAPATPDSASNTNWQRTRFFNAFSFAYPQGWTMERLGDAAHLLGDYQGRTVVTDIVWVRDAPQVAIEQWARADLQQLGVNLDGMRIDFTPRGNDAQIAIVSGIRLEGYDCPVVRMYVVANNAAAGGQRSYAVTVAQANGQSCDPKALEGLAYRMVQQA